jgi:hypothetical protein
VLRALKVLSEREVTPQLGLLKSTLLQLDSTFSEREYGASSFRDFMEKVAQTGAVELKHAGRSMLVEAVSGAAKPPRPRRLRRSRPRAAAVRRAGVRLGNGCRRRRGRSEDDEETLPPSPMSMQDGIKAVQHAFRPRALDPVADVRAQARQFLRTAIQGFDERKYGLPRWSICCARRARKACSASSATARARSRVPGREPRPEGGAMEACRSIIDETIGRRGAGGARGRRRDHDRSADVEGTVDPVACPRVRWRPADIDERSNDERGDRRRRPAARQLAARAGEPRAQDQGGGPSRAPRAHAAPRGAPRRPARARANPSRGRLSRAVAGRSEDRPYFSIHDLHVPPRGDHSTRRAAGSALRRRGARRQDVVELRAPRFDDVAAMLMRVAGRRKRSTCTTIS